MIHDHFFQPGTACEVDAALLLLKQHFRVRPHEILCYDFVSITKLMETLILYSI
jgi:hypothetical protein